MSGQSPMSNVQCPMSVFGTLNHAATNFTETNLIKCNRTLDFGPWTLDIGLPVVNGNDP